MPRAKVLPKDRKRVARACETCRTSKRRCDGIQPCRICVKLGRQQWCSFASSHRQGSAERTSADAADNDDSIFFDGHDAVINTQLLNAPPTASTTESASPAQRVVPPLSPPSSNGRIFLNAQGERVYINNTSSLSFLQFLKTTLKTRLAPSTFTTDPPDESLYESSDQQNPLAAVYLDDTAKGELVDCYFIATCGLLDVFERDEADDYLTQDALARETQDSSWRLRAASLRLMIAIGAQSRASSQEDVDIAAGCFAHARATAFEKQLENPSVDLIRVFLLMAFYMIGASRRHAAVMHIGVAATAATMLGLHHTEHYAGLPHAQAAVRWRTYRGLVLMDLLNATLLGRHTLTPMLTNGSPSVLGESSPDVSVPTFPEAAPMSFDICHVLQSVANDIARIGHLGTRRAAEVCERVLRRVEQFKAEQSGVMRVTSRVLSTHPGRATAAGRLHVSCICCHALAIVARPALVDCLLAANVDGGVSSLTQLTDSLARTCVDAALLATQVSYEAFTAGLLMNNMCHVLRPILFESALVLGFVLAVYRTDTEHIEDGFRKARKLLKHFSKTATLSKVFYEILTSLLDAIVRQRVGVARNKVRNALPCADRIVQFDVRPQQSESCGWKETQNGLVTNGQTAGLDPGLEGFSFDNFENLLDLNSDMWQLFSGTSLTAAIPDILDSDTIR